MMMKKISYFIVAFAVFLTTSVVPVLANSPNNEDEKDSNSNDYYFTDALDATIPVALQLDLDSDLESEVYTVEVGDNLYRIALAHNVSLESIVGWNNLTDYLIYPGQELKVNGEEVKGTDIEKSFVASAPVVPASQPFVQAKEPSSAPTENKAVKELTVTATAYTAYCEGCSGTTAYGIDLRANPNRKVIAVDPRIIPLGTKVWVEGYGEAIAGDTGGAIKGHKIDVFIPSHENAIAWGVKTVKLRVLN
jgi:N-acetylmuramoyl-L-alanine amidase